MSPGSTYTDLDVGQEKRIDGYWNVDQNRNLSDSWSCFTRFTLLNEKPPKGYMWSGWRLTKIQTTSRPDHIWPDAWTRIRNAAQRREKQEWAIEKPKLEYGRNVKGIFSIDPSDEEYKDIIENARRKLETPMAAEMPCKREFSRASTRETVVSRTEKAKASEAKTRFSCIAEAHESTRQRIESVRKKGFMRVTLQGEDRILSCITFCSPDNSSLEKDQKQHNPIPSESSSWSDEECEQFLQFRAQILPMKRSQESFSLFLFEKM